ncbi:hypothetical protein SVIOM74S_09083 [Streptomyces violarus]
MSDSAVSRGMRSLIPDGSTHCWPNRPAAMSASCRARDASRCSSCRRRARLTKARPASEDSIASLLQDVTVCRARQRRSRPSRCSASAMNAYFAGTRRW